MDLVCSVEFQVMTTSSTDATDKSFGQFNFQCYIFISILYKSLILNFKNLTWKLWMKLYFLIVCNVIRDMMLCRQLKLNNDAIQSGRIARKPSQSYKAFMLVHIIW